MNQPNKTVHYGQDFPSEVKKAVHYGQDLMNPRSNSPDFEPEETKRVVVLFERFLEKVGKRAIDGSVSFTGQQWSLIKQDQRLCIFEQNRKLWESQGDAIVTFKMNALELEKLRQLCQHFEADPSLSEPIVHSYSREQGQTSLQMNQLTKPLQR